MADNRPAWQRRAGIQIRAAEGMDAGEMVVEGLAIVYGTPTVLFEEGGIEYREIIDGHALDGASMDDTVLRYNHMSSVPVLARVRGGSLQLDNRADGLYFRGTLFNTSAARDCFELIRQGALQCSFGFSMSPEGGFTYDRATHTRTVMRIKTLHDVAVVDMPAYNGTFVNARGAFFPEAEDAGPEGFRALESERLKRLRELIARTI